MPLLEIRSEITGSVWKLVKAPGDAVAEEEPIMVLESMKMEIPVMAETAGTLRQVLVKEGDSVSEGQLVAVVET